jgi:hypothetical protein
MGNRNDVFALDVSQSPAVWAALESGDKLKNTSANSCNFPPDFTDIDAMAPERRSAFAFAPTADGLAFVVHGGGSDCGLVNDAWWWSDPKSAWTAVKQSPVGLSCLRTKTSCTSLCN